jgi:hypothetical protein
MHISRSNRTAKNFLLSAAGALIACGSLSAGIAPAADSALMIPVQCNDIRSFEVEIGDVGGRDLSIFAAVFGRTDCQLYEQ